MVAHWHLDSGSSQWAHRQKELLSRRLYMKNFWYAAGEPPSRALSGFIGLGNMVPVKQMCNLCSSVRSYKHFVTTVRIASPAQ